MRHPLLPILAASLLAAPLTAEPVIDGSSAPLWTACTGWVTVSYTHLTLPTIYSV